MGQESINERIRNKLSPFKNVIALIERYETSISGEEKRKAIGLIIKEKSALQHSLNELIEIQ